MRKKLPEGCCKRCQLGLLKPAVRRREGGSCCAHVIRGHGMSSRAVSLRAKMLCSAEAIHSASTAVSAESMHAKGVGGVELRADVEPGSVTHAGYDNVPPVAWDVAWDIGQIAWDNDQKQQLGGECHRHGQSSMSSETSRDQTSP